MNSKLITILVLVLMVWVGYRLVVNYKETSAQRQLEEEQANISAADLSGLPYQLRSSLQTAQAQGAKGLRLWLDQFGFQVQDPRKAWIELDYCTMIAREDPQEAQAVFASVKARVRPDSPVYPRIKQLEKSLE